MDEAFDIYFQKLSHYAESIGEQGPTVEYNGDLDSNLVITPPDDEGYVLWVPQKPLTPIDWDFIETELGFKLVDELKEYYSSFLFANLSGTLSGVILYFFPIVFEKNRALIVLQNYRDAQLVLPGSQCFLIGNCNIDGDDGYFLFFDNQTSELFCYENDTCKRRTLSNSISNVIQNMEAIE